MGTQIISYVVVGFVVLFLLTLIILAARNTIKGRKDRYVEPQKPVKKPKQKKGVTGDEKKVSKKPKKQATTKKAKKEEKEVWKLKMPEPKSLEEGLRKTRREGLFARVKTAVSGGTRGEETLEALEEALITADCGVSTSMEMVEALRKELSTEDLTEPNKVFSLLKEKMITMLARDSRFLEPFPEKRPAVIMVVGVNGTGKTTTIGKLALKYKSEGYKVLLAAGDTFRAAGSTQLEKWAQKVDVPIVQGADKADPASIIFDAIKQAQTDGLELVIADTAGRLHTDVNLVDELRKIHRVIGKAQEGAPNECMLVLDAGMGQNSIRQAEEFKKAVDVTSIAITKLDGTAKGGVVLSIVRDLGLPVSFIGIGEGVTDLRPFEPKAFVDAMFAEDKPHPKQENVNSIEN